MNYLNFNALVIDQDCSASSSVDRPDNLSEEEEEAWLDLDDRRSLACDFSEPYSAPSTPKAEPILDLGDLREAVENAHHDLVGLYILLLQHLGADAVSGYHFVNPSPNPSVEVNLQVEESYLQVMASDPFDAPYSVELAGQLYDGLLYAEYQEERDPEEFRQLSVLQLFDLLRQIPAQEHVYFSYLRDYISRRLKDGNYYSATSGATDSAFSFHSGASNYSDPNAPPATDSGLDLSIHSLPTGSIPTSPTPSGEAHEVNASHSLPSDPAAGSSPSPSNSLPPLPDRLPDDFYLDGGNTTSRRHGDGPSSSPSLPSAAENRLGLTPGPAATSPLATAADGVADSSPFTDINPGDSPSTQFFDDAVNTNTFHRSAAEIVSPEESTTPTTTPIMTPDASPYQLAECNISVDETTTFDMASQDTFTSDNPPAGPTFHGPDSVVPSFEDPLFEDHSESVSSSAEPGSSTAALSEGNLTTVGEKKRKREDSSGSE